MAATKAKHFSECLYLINEVMERTTVWLSSQTLPPLPCLLECQRRREHFHKCLLPLKSCLVHKVLKEGHKNKTHLGSFYIQMKDKHFFHHVWTSLMKANALSFVFDIYLGPDAYARCTCGHHWASYTDGHAKCARVAMAVRGKVVMPHLRFVSESKELLLLCSHYTQRVIRNKWYLFTFLIQAKT